MIAWSVSQKNDSAEISPPFRQLSLAKFLQLYCRMIHYNAWTHRG
jgi:hypothetical protein